LIGIASSTARCGTVGGSSVRKFVVIGECVTQSVMLCLVAAAAGISVVVDQDVKNESTVGFRFVIVDRVDFTENQTKLVYELREQVKGDGQEWMYELSQAKSDDVYDGYNKAFEAYLQGRSEHASSLLQLVNVEVNSDRLQQLLAKDAEMGESHAVTFCMY